MHRHWRLFTCNVCTHLHLHAHLHMHLRLYLHLHPRLQARASGKLVDSKALSELVKSKLTGGKK